MNSIIETSDPKIELINDRMEKFRYRIYDGHNLEYFHILGITIIIIAGLIAILSFKIKKLTTEEL